MTRDRASRNLRPVRIEALFQPIPAIRVVVLQRGRLRRIFRHPLRKARVVLDARTLAGSQSCGTTNCHAEIVKEWLPSAHRYAAMDPLFQFIQTTMATQNGPESTRYCGGCHDPISLFSDRPGVYVRPVTDLLPALPENWDRCLAVAAHPDDIEYGTASAVLENEVLGFGQGMKARYKRLMPIAALSQTGRRD